MVDNQSNGGHMAVNRSVVSSVVRPVVNPIISAIRRHFTTLTAAGSQHYTIPTVTLTGDYKISVLVYYIGINIDMYGDVAANRDRARVTGTGAIQWRPAGGTAELATANGIVPQDKLSIIEVERIGGTGTISLNGVVVASSPSITTALLEFNAIGNSNGEFSTGIIANLKITDAGTLIRDYKIDEDWTGPSTVLHDSSGNNQHGTSVNIDSTDAELFTRFNNVSPNEFRNGDGSVILEISGT